MSIKKLGPQFGDIGPDNTPSNLKTALPLDPTARHYDAGGLETIEVIRAKLTEEQFVGFLLGNIIKYSCRANWKGSMAKDIGKMSVYAEMLQTVQPEPSDVAEELHDQLTPGKGGVIR